MFIKTDKQNNKISYLHVGNIPNEFSIEEIANVFKVCEILTVDVKKSSFYEQRKKNKSMRLYVKSFCDNEFAYSFIQDLKNLYCPCNINNINNSENINLICLIKKFDKKTNKFINFKAQLKIRKWVDFKKIEKNNSEPVTKLIRELTTSETIVF